MYALPSNIHARRNHEMYITLHKLTGFSLFNEGSSETALEKKRMHRNKFIPKWQGGGGPEHCAILSPTSLLIIHH